MIDQIKSTYELTNKLVITHESLSVFSFCISTPICSPLTNVKASFAGVMVLPEFRNQGIGKFLLLSILNLCGQRGLVQLKVFIFSPFDNLALGPPLYLKYGGKLIAEYIHLEKNGGLFFEK